MKRLTSRLLLAPAVVTLFVWMIVPLVMTSYFSLLRYNLLEPGAHAFAGIDNYFYFFTDAAFAPAVKNTLLLLLSVMGITVVAGIALALLINEPFPGRAFVRLLLVSPFFVMPAVNALMWKNMMMNPIYGLFAQLSHFLGFAPIDWLSEYPLLSIILMIAWQWLPFACLIFMTALQSMDREQLEAARMDGANYPQQVRYLYLPHLGRSIAVVIMIEMIFLLSVFAEIFTTTGGGPGFETTSVAFMIFRQALSSFDVGVASAGGLFVVLLANIAAIFFIRIVGKNLEN
jgi:sorbitol/mannitol transport system permease protein